MSGVGTRNDCETDQEFVQRCWNEGVRVPPGRFYITEPIIGIRGSGADDTFIMCGIAAPWWRRARNAFLYHWPWRGFPRVP